MEVAATGGGGCAGFWVVILFQGIGCFRVYSENTSSYAYCDILDNYLAPTVQLYDLQNNYFFQHDNARYHISNHGFSQLWSKGKTSKRNNVEK